MSSRDTHGSFMTPSYHCHDVGALFGSTMREELLDCRERLRDAMQREDTQEWRRAFNEVEALISMIESAQAVLMPLWDRAAPVLEAIGYDENNNVCDLIDASNTRRVLMERT